MDSLLEAVKSGSLDAVRKVIVSSEEIPLESRLIDYISANQAIVDEHEDIATYLLDHNCRVKNSRENVMPEETPLHYAVKRNNARLVSKLLENGASVKSVNRQGYSPLHLALILEHEVVIDVLLNFIVRTNNYENIRSKNGLTHFHVACTRKNVQAIEGFINSEVDVNEAINENSDYRPGYTAQHFAAEFQSLEAVRVLANATGRERSFAKDQNGQCALDLARKSMEELTIMVYILSGDSRPKAMGCPTKMSPFHVACTQDNPQFVKKFIENGVAVNNFISKESILFPGCTPLHCAVEGNCRANVELLLKETPDVQCRDVDFATPLHLAMYNEDPEESHTIVDLIYNTLDFENKMLNIMDVRGLNYLHLAVSRNELDLVKAFLDRGEDIEHKVLHNHRNFVYYTPLHFAIRYKHFEMTKYLIERGADAKAICKDGPALQLAIEAGQTDIIDLLLEKRPKASMVRKSDSKTMIHSLVETYMKNRNTVVDGIKVTSEFINDRLLAYIEPLVHLGCDVNYRDDDGNTALHIACEKICHGITCVRILLNFGADINVENYDGDTPFDCAFHDLYRMNGRSYMLLYHHVQKLKIFGFKVNVKNERCCQRIIDECDECEPNAACFRMAELDYMKERRRKEVATMKAFKLTGFMSLYGFVLLDKIDAAMYITNVKLKQLIEDEEEMRDKYTLYGYLIRLQFDRTIAYLKSISNESRPAVKRKRCE